MKGRGFVFNFSTSIGIRIGISILFLLLMMPVLYTASSSQSPTANGEVILSKTTHHSYYVTPYYNKSTNNLYGILIECNSTTNVGETRSKVIANYQNMYNSYLSIQNSQSPDYETYIKNALDKIGKNTKTTKGNTKCAPATSGVITFGFINQISKSPTVIVGCNRNIKIRQNAVTINNQLYPAAKCNVHIDDPPFSLGCTNTIVYSEDPNTPTLPGYLPICPKKEITNMPLINFKKTFIDMLTVSSPNGGNYICFLAALLFAMLLANMYMTGKNPLSLLDLTVPRTPKPKGWTQLNPVVTSRSYGEMNKQSKKIIKSTLKFIENEMKMKLKGRITVLKGEESVLEAIRFLARKLGVSLSEELIKATSLNGLSVNATTEIGKILGKIESENARTLNLDKSVKEENSKGSSSVKGKSVGLAESEIVDLERDLILASKVKEYLEHSMNVASMSSMGGNIGKVSSLFVRGVNKVIKEGAQFNRLGHSGEAMLWFPTTMIRTSAIGFRALVGGLKAGTGWGAVLAGKMLRSKGISRWGHGLVEKAGVTMGRLYPVLDKMKETYKQEMERLYDLLVVMSLKNLLMSDSKLKQDLENLLKTDMYTALTNATSAKIVSELITNLNTQSTENLKLTQFMKILKLAQEGNHNSEWIFREMKKDEMIRRYVSREYRGIYSKLNHIQNSKDEDYVKLVRLYTYEYYGIGNQGALIERLPILDREHMGGRDTNSDVWTTLILGNLLEKYKQGYRVGLGDSLGEVFGRMFNYTFGLGFKIDDKGGIDIKIGKHGGYYRDKEELSRFIRSDLSVNAIRTAAKGLYQNLSKDGIEALAKNMGISTSELGNKVKNDKLNPIDLVNVLYQMKDLQKMHGLVQDKDGMYVESHHLNEMTTWSGLGRDELGANKRYWKTDMSGLWHDGLDKRNSYTTVEQVFNKATYGKYGLGRLPNDVAPKNNAEDAAVTMRKLMGHKTEDIALNFMNGAFGNLYDGQFRRRAEFDMHAVVGTLAHMIRYDESIPEAERLKLANQIMGILEPGMNLNGSIEAAYDSLTSGQYRAKIKTNQEFMKKLERVLGNPDIKEKLETHIKDYQVRYMDTVRHPYVGLNEGTFVPLTKGTPVSDYDLVVGGRSAIKGRDGRYYEFDPDATSIDYGGSSKTSDWNESYKNALDPSISLTERRTIANGLINDLKAWYTGGSDASKGGSSTKINDDEYLKRVYTFARVVHDLSESLGDPTMMNQAPTSIREHYDVHSHSEGKVLDRWTLTPVIPIPIPKKLRDAFLNQIVHRGFASLANRTLAATHPLTHSMYANVAISERARQTSFNNMLYIKSLTEDDWDRISGIDRNYRNNLRESTNDFFPYHTSWSQVIDRDPRNASTSHSIQNTLSGFFNFGPSRNFPMAAHEKTMSQKKSSWSFIKRIEYPWTTDYAADKLSSLTDTFRTVQQAMQGYPGRWDVANPNNPFQARGYYTPIRLREAMAGFNPFSIDESEKITKSWKSKQWNFMNIAKAFLPFGGSRQKHSLIKSAMYKLDSSIRLRNPSERADLSGIRIMNGLRQSPHEVMHIYSGIDANARVGDANPGVSYYDQYHRLKSDTNVSQYLAYEFGRYSNQNFSGYFKGNEGYSSMANTPLIKRDNNITAETLLSQREHELKNFGFWRNPVYGWFSPVAFIWHNPFVSSVSVRAATMGLKNSISTKEGRDRFGRWIRDIGRRLEPKKLPKLLLDRLNPINPYGTTSVRYCPNCGARIIGKGSICPGCGNKLPKKDMRY